MYNGIGLPTPRGSGTNGYVQRNFALVRSRKEKVDYKTEDDFKRLEASSNKKPNEDILEHERKRKVELKCMELKELMEEQGDFSPDIIEQKVSEFRFKLMEKEGVSEHVIGRFDVRETHHIAEANLEKNQRLREAFGISEYFVEGSSLDPNRKEKEKAAALAAASVQKTYEIIRESSSSPSPERNRKKRKRKLSASNQEKSRSPEAKKEKKKKSKKHKKEERCNSPPASKKKKKKKSSEKHKHKRSRSVNEKNKKKRSRYSSDESDSSRDSESSCSRNSSHEQSKAPVERHENVRENAASAYTRSSTSELAHSRKSGAPSKERMCVRRDLRSLSHSASPPPTHESRMASHSRNKENTTSKQYSRSSSKDFSKKPSSIVSSGKKRHDSSSSASSESVHSNDSSSSSSSSTSSSSSASTPKRQATSTVDKRHDLIENPNMDALAKAFQYKTTSSREEKSPVVKHALSNQSPKSRKDDKKEHSLKSKTPITFKSLHNKVRKDHSIRNGRTSSSSSSISSSSKSPSPQPNAIQSFPRSPPARFSRSSSRSPRNSLESAIRQKSTEPSPHRTYRLQLSRSNSRSNSRSLSHSLSRSPDVKRSRSNSSRSLSYSPAERHRSVSRSRSHTRSRSRSRSYRSRSRSYSGSCSRSRSGSNRRSPSIPRRRGSPSFLDKRRITRSNRWRPRRSPPIRSHRLQRPYESRSHNNRSSPSRTSLHRHRSSKR